MAGEIKLNNVSIATENAGTVTINNATLGNSMVLGTNASPIANNLVFANGYGIDFSAAAGSAAGSSSALLDDYEEGTWTPGLTVGSPNGTTEASYVKIGRQVIIHLYLTSISDITSSSPCDITGLPFTSSGDIDSYVGTVMLRYLNAPTGTNNIIAFMSANTTQMRMYNVVDSTTYDVISYNDFVSALVGFRIQLNYLTD